MLLPRIVLGPEQLKVVFLLILKEDNH